jgi:hypothetical protein
MLLSKFKLQLKTGMSFEVAMFVTTEDHFDFPEIYWLERCERSEHRDNHYTLVSCCCCCLVRILSTLRIVPDVGKIILKVISDQIKIIFSKNDFKSDQDHIFFKMILISNQDQRSFFVSKVPFLRVKISNRTKSRL